MNERRKRRPKFHRLRSSPRSLWRKPGVPGRPRKVPLRRWETSCPLDGATMYSTKTAQGKRRYNYATHIDRAHPHLSERERSLLADQLRDREREIVPT